MGKVVVSGLQVEPTSLLLTRYRAGWLQGATPHMTSRFCNAGAPALIRGSRNLLAGTTAVADDGSSIVTYLDAEGVNTIFPRILR